MSRRESCNAGFGHVTILEPPDLVREIRWFSAEVNEHEGCTGHQHSAVMNGRLYLQPGDG